MFGQGLLKGLAITWKELFTRKVTVQYPEEKVPLPERYHGRFELDVDKCIACGLCANACPNKVIQITREKVGKKQYLTKYVMRIEYCLFCGLCVESCNKDALKFSHVINMNQFFRDKVRLVLVDRPAPEALPEEEPAEAAAERPAGARAKTARAEVAAGKAPGEEG
ncbi:4Fe-4S ferredoxin iron-sulfur binding domain-containing protein [Desulfofundulus kuznetsovii DSM 6115]|uniref:4Fe-4S ferredoxin iron-sulfur binding domain-containing protein n=1 Tax=Desulfofundulus kuznetsovii (strain DSM 6115 / VKM B-1805 / 17) TaxID=760568 RepID=A0AAU8PAI7_DESK7|nr:4Fe-4S ferredoxin iron-sulfur binding domain-containing protein [Desulfofundulus kuznetsovii DSM 6115]